MQDKNERLAARIRRVMQAMPPHSRKVPRRGLRVYSGGRPIGWLTFQQISESSKARNKPRPATLYRYPILAKVPGAIAADIAAMTIFDWKT